MDKDLSGKLSIKLTLFIWLCLAGLVAHVFIDNIHQVEFWGIANQTIESARLHSISELLEHEDDCVPFASKFTNTEKPQSPIVVYSQLPVFSILISPLLPPPKTI